ncbi:MAG: DUF5060 domain-containing protein [Planctomycetota bacterium]|jgi:CubicO group peptidase (beta-lactamase class C family)
MKLTRILLMGLLVSACTRISEGRAGEAAPVYPGKKWATKKPEEVGLDAKKLKELSDYAGGFGCVVRHGYMVYTWGDASKRKDIASAAKPFYAHFLFKAVEDGKITSLDERVNKWEPRLNKINKNLGYKDRDIKWRHFANQTSCYGLTEAPGTAYAYNDWQMALFWDTLFGKVYGVSCETVDADVLHPLLTDKLQCQDNPTFMAFGVKDRAGRTAISPRDFARFGLLYLRKGKWKDKQLISREHATMAVTDPVPNAIPRAGNEAADMIPGQRSIGSRQIPDNQCDHAGSYSWLWWTNGVGQDGARHWPDVPIDAYGCFGHGGPRAMVVVPSLDLIISWNDAKIRSAEMENHALGLLVAAASSGQKENVGNRSRDFGNRTGVMWEYMEWSLKSVPYSGNPFDVSATVTFSHGDSGQERTTEMFYDGDDAWRFRFTGTRTGKWTFKTSSDVPELNGHAGSVTIAENPDRSIRGFLTHVGNKYAIQVKDETDLRGYLFNVYMSRVEYPAFLDEFGSDLGEVEKKALAYLTEARENGFEIIFLHVNSNWFKFGVRRHDEHDSASPDPAAFGVLETIVQTVHQAGGRAHIWAWGDESRKWTPRGVPGGINGKTDRRLQRYIAARLGPLPGWTIGYGFDLHEWTNTEQLNAWAAFLHKHFGWQHLLCARGYRLEGPFNINSYDGFGRNVPLATTRHGPQSYEEIVEDLNSDLTRPHLYEERHSHKREGFNLDMDGTRRLLWWESMAGGMGGFFGFYPDSPHPYPNPEQLRMHYDFWHKGGRFLLDMQPANELTESQVPQNMRPADELAKNRCALWSDSASSGIFYWENAYIVEVDLPSGRTPLPIWDFDTKKTLVEGRKWVNMCPPVGGGFGFFLDNPKYSDRVLSVGFGHKTEQKPTEFSGLITVDSNQPQWPKYVWAPVRPFLMCGPGDPEDFLYRGKINPDGTRDGDQMQLIDRLKIAWANCIYLMAVRSHGGDGDETHNPFIDHDPAKGINPRVLDQWEQWFVEMDRHCIVIYFFIYDDSALVWNTGDEVGKPEHEFIQTLVNRFEHHGHLIWCIAEEYAERLSAERVKKIAALIRATDDYNHPVAVHKNHGLDFSEFADDANIDQFAIQYNVKTAEELHAGVVKAWKNAKGRYSLNLSEAADWGTGIEARKKSWACAMGGASVMILGMHIANTSGDDLSDCGTLRRFFESVDLRDMEPHDELAYAGTEYVLAKPGERYVAYTSRARGKIGLLGGRIGLRNMKAGKYHFGWFDCRVGEWWPESPVDVGEGDHIWRTPIRSGKEVAVYINRIGE